MPVKRHRTAESDSELDMTPMLDVVFIMLIFFIVSTSFVKASGVSVSTPSAVTASKQDNANIFIAITDQGDVWIDKHKVDIRTVRSIVSRLHADNPKGAVIVQADKKAQADHILQILDQVRLAGITDVAIAAKQAKSL